MQQPYAEHYVKLLASAEIALEGPQGVAIGTDFWGGSLLSLRHSKVPKIEGVIESRVVYANLADEEQTTAILRQVTWNAAAVRKIMIEDSKLKRKVSIAYPELIMHSVWIDLSEVHEMIRLIEALQIPGKALDAHSEINELYRFQFERENRTTLTVSWNAGWKGSFTSLSKVWLTIWEQMDKLLQQNVNTLYEERWGHSHFPLPAIYNFHDGTKREVNFGP